MTTDERCQFAWHSFDVRGLLPKNWQEQILEVAKKEHISKTIIPKSVTSRESEDVKEIPVKTVGGKKIKDILPWLFDLYMNEFRELGQKCVTEPLSTARDVRYSVNLNVQQGKNMRYEAHVDSNPLEGVLYVTSHSEGSGGETVFGNILNIKGIKEIDQDCARIFPVSGHLMFFDARKHSHYVAPLVNDNDIRVVVAMNFYMPSCSEADRPSDLNAHLGLD